MGAIKAKQVSGVGGHPVDDTTALVQDPSDNTRKGRIDVGAVGPGETRALMVPNHDVTLVSADDAAGPGDLTKAWTADRLTKYTLDIDNSGLSDSDDGRLVFVNSVDKGVGANTVLMLHMVGADGTTAFPDASTSGHSVTAFGNAQIDTAQFRTGNSSALFDGVGDYLQIPDSGDWTMGTGNLTYDFWFRFSNLTATGGQVMLGDDATPSARVTFDPDLTRWTVNLGTTEQYFTDTLSIDTWYHCAVTRSGGSVRLFRDGVQRGSTQTNTSNVDPVQVHIGINNGSDNPFHGWIDELRITKAEALWTSNFTPPTLYLAKTYEPATQAGAPSINGNGVLSSPVDGAFADVPTSPAAYSVSQNALPVNGKGYARISFSVINKAVRGIVAGVDGEELTVINIGTDAFKIIHQSTSAVVADRVVMPGATFRELFTDDFAKLWYDATTARWRLLATSA